MAGFEMQFPASELDALAARYEYADDGDLLALGAAARARGHYTRRELIEVCAWKTPRSRSLVASDPRHAVTSRPSLARRNRRIRTHHAAPRAARRRRSHRLDAAIRRIPVRLSNPRRPGTGIARREVAQHLPGQLLASLSRRLQGTRVRSRRQRPNPRQGAVAALQRALRRSQAPVGRAPV